MAPPAAAQQHVNTLPHASRTVADPIQQCVALSPSHARLHHPARHAQGLMNLIFEVADLAVASPATVSRCGMVYVQVSTLLTAPWLLRAPWPMPLRGFASAPLEGPLDSQTSSPCGIAFCTRHRPSIPLCTTMPTCSPTCWAGVPFSTLGWRRCLKPSLRRTGRTSRPSSAGCCRRACGWQPRGAPRCARLLG